MKRFGGWWRITRRKSLWTSRYDAPDDDYYYDRPPTRAEARKPPDTPPQPPPGQYRAPTTSAGSLSLTEERHSQGTLPSIPKGKPLVVAAVDFGTHGTGFAWALVKDLEEDSNTSKINYYSEWPGTLTSYPKNLSALLLDGKEVKYWGHEAKRRWAQAIADSKEGNLSYAYAFKMALKPSQYADSLPRGQGRIKVQSPRDAYPLIVEYLKRIYQKAIEAILQTGYRETQVNWCVTIPAIWDAADRALMRDAAVEAGFPGQRLLLVQEPEAAALQCRVHTARLSVLTGKDGEHYDLHADGARFIVVDCGGGTVDITAYRVVGPPEGQQQLAELCKASGGKFGSEYINRAFVEKALTEHFGGREFIDKLQQRFPQDLLEIVDKWERAKVNLQVRADGQAGTIEVLDSVNLTIPSSIIDYTKKHHFPVREDGGHRIILQPAEIEEIFEGIISPVLKEIEGQLEEVRKNAGQPSGPEILLLVGGFAASKYLQESIKLRFHDQIVLIVPEKPAAAVMFGAVRLCHRPTTIRSRRARYTYGYSCYLPFDETLDDESRRILDDEGRSHCERFVSVIRIGEAVEVGKITAEPLYPLVRRQDTITVVLLASTEADPRYSDDQHVSKLGYVTVDISESSGQELADRNITLELRFGDTEIRAGGSNPRTRKKYQTNVDFDYY